MSFEVTEHVTREPEEVTAGERRPERPGEMPAEQECSPGGERRQEDCEDVVGDNRACCQRDRRE